VKVLQRLRGYTPLRYIGLSLSLVVALLAAAIVASLTIDLGPVVRARAEDAGSKYIERPLHIGALKIHLLTDSYLNPVLTTVMTELSQQHDVAVFDAKTLPAFAAGQGFKQAVDKTS